MYLYRVEIPQGYIFEEVLYFWLKPGNYPFGRLELVKKLSKDEEDDYDKAIRSLQKIITPDAHRGWNKYKITTPKGFSFEATLPSGLEPNTYQFGKVELLKNISEDEQKHEIFTVLALWEEHLPIEKDSDDMDEDIIKNKIEKSLENVIMKKIIIIGIGEMYKHQLQWVSDVLPTKELKQMFLNGQIDLYDMMSYPEKGDAVDAILRDAEDVAAVIAVHLYWKEDLSPVKVPYFYNEKNEYLPIITKELNIPFIVMGDQPDGTFAHVKIYNIG